MLKIQAGYQVIELRLQLRFLLIEFLLPVARFGDRDFLIGQLSGVILHHLLLAADLREAGDIFAVALLILSDGLNVGGDPVFFRVSCCDLSFQVGDLL